MVSLPGARLLGLDFRLPWLRVAPPSRLEETGPGAGRFFRRAPAVTAVLAESGPGVRAAGVALLRRRCSRVTPASAALTALPDSTEVAAERRLDGGRVAGGVGVGATLSVRETGAGAFSTVVDAVDRVLVGGGLEDAGLRVLVAVSSKGWETPPTMLVISAETSLPVLRLLESGFADVG